MNDSGIIYAIERLNQDVVNAFKQHDTDLRGEVEKVNRGILYLLGSIGILFVALLVWPKRRA
jgi:hypothetical protein